MAKKNSGKRFLKGGKKVKESRRSAGKKRASAKIFRKAQNKHAIKSVKNKAPARNRHVGVSKKPEARVVQAIKNGARQQQKREGKANKYIPSQKETKEALNILFGNEFAIDYLKKNVNKSALDVLMLLQSPNTDEAIAMQLGMKVNSVRRILNIMQGYGITNYYVAKNTNGWLSFAWYVNTNKMGSFFDYIKSMKGDEYSIIKEDCNDYFICKKCYSEDSLIFTFDAAYEAGFRCASCGGKFDMIGKEEARGLITLDRQKQESALLNLKTDADEPKADMSLPLQQQKKRSF